MKRFFHFLLAAVAALTISFSFFSVVSSAEATVSDTLDITEFKDGVLGEYPVVNSLYSDGFIKAYLNTTSDTSHGTYDFYLPFVSFNNTLYFADELCYIYYNRSYSSGLNNITYCLGGNVLFNPITSNKDFSTSSRIDDFHNISYSLSGTTYTFKNFGYTYTCTFDFTSTSGDVLPSEGDYSIMFARVVSTKNANSVGAASSYISSNLSFSLDQSAKFLKLVDSTAESKLNICDWMRSGYQYPIVDFQINDNSYMDSYILKVGSNSTKTDMMKNLYQEQQVKDWLSAALNFSGAALGINIPNGTDFVKNQIQLAKALTTCDTWDYDTVTTISSDLFTFSDPNVLSSIFSVNLSDYLSIVPYNIYRLDIVSKSSAKILATCFFTSERSYTRGNSGYGVKVYSYGSVSDANSDSSNNDYSNKPPTTTGNIADSTNVSDTVSNNFNNSLSNLDISSTFSSFESALNSVSSFFQACWGLFPPAIWAIILCGISLIIILRVLGR